MISITTSAPKEAITPRSDVVASFGPAINHDAIQFAQKIDALHSPPSPASLPIEPAVESSQRQLFDALANVKILTSQVAMHMEREWRDRLFQQLDSLHDIDEWEDGDHPIQQSSFSTFLKAMLSIKPDRRPGLGLSHAGHLIAAWTTDQDRLTIEFLPNDRIRWVLSHHYNGDVERYAGDSAISRLSDGLLGHHPEHWFSNGSKSY